MGDMNRMVRHEGISTEKVLLEVAIEGLSCQPSRLFSRWLLLEGERGVAAFDSGFDWIPASSGQVPKMVAQC